MKIDWKSMDIAKTACAAAGHLEKHKINAILVGGACVSIYSRNEFLSYDLDFVTECGLKELRKILGEIGFQNKGGRLFENKECEYFIDFVMPPVCVGNEPVSKINTIRTKFGILKLLTPADCIKDRLAAFYHWNDYQSLEQAVMVAKKQKGGIKISELEKWSLKEKQAKKFEVFKKKIK